MCTLPHNCTVSRETINGQVDKLCSLMLNLLKYDFTIHIL